MQISQIFLSDSNQPLPPPLVRASSTVAIAFPDAKRTIYSKDSLRQFIVDHFDLEVVRAYDKLRPYAYKADLGRYCLLYENGGWYADISIRFLGGITPRADTALLAFRDIQRHSRTIWSCSIAVLYSAPRNKCFETAIEYVLMSCREQYYGVTPLCPTGPTLFGRALAAQRARPDYIFGEAMYLTPDYPQKNRAYVLPDGQILALAKPTQGGDLTQFGANGVNNYNEFWHKREVYEPDVEPPRTAT